MVSHLVVWFATVVYIYVTAKIQLLQCPQEGQLVNSLIVLVYTFVLKANYLFKLFCLYQKCYHMKIFQPRFWCEIEALGSSDILLKCNQLANNWYSIQSLLFKHISKEFGEFKCTKNYDSRHCLASDVDSGHLPRLTFKFSEPLVCTRWNQTVFCKAN